MKKTKFIFVTGGVLSGLGKGITAASLGTILKARGFSVYCQKFDQYLNVDAGTLNPGEHGEVFVTDDGAETDLDLGHYERFLNQNLAKVSSVMSGNIYQAVLDQERRGDFLGKTVQVIPHLTNEVKSRIREAASFYRTDILITEIGGTVGDFEGLHFLEAIRQMKKDEGEGNVLFVHVGYITYLPTTQEYKTKPLQNSIHDLQGLGIQPDIIIARYDNGSKLSTSAIAKISMFGGIEEKAIIPLPTLPCVFEVPFILEQNSLGNYICKKLHLPLKKPNFIKWEKLLEKVKVKKEQKIKIGLVGKYMAMKDTYLSVTEAIKTAALWNDVDLEIVWIDSEKIEKTKDLSPLYEVNGIVVPGGFGNRGIEGKIMAIKYARENGLPFLGLCLGLQTAVIELARNVCGLKGANSTEFAPKTKYPVIDIMPEQKKVTTKGATMRLGAYPCNLQKGSLTASLYGKTKICERHRHRYEVNPKYHKILQKKGIGLVGLSPDKRLVEFIELKNHPFFVATQAHPEFKSRPLSPHPLFAGLIKATVKIQKEKVKS